MAFGYYARLLLLFVDYVDDDGIMTVVRMLLWNKKENTKIDIGKYGELMDDDGFSVSNQWLLMNGLMMKNSLLNSFTSHFYIYFSVRRFVY